MLSPCAASRSLWTSIAITLLNPALIVEVLWPSTAAYDRGRKFEQYCSIDSPAGYLVVASDRVRADLYRRRVDGW